MLTAIIIIIVLALFVEWDCHLIRNTYHYFTKEKQEQKKIEPPFRYGSKVLILHGAYRDREGIIGGTKIGDEWHVKVTTGTGWNDYKFAWVPEGDLRLLEDPVLPKLSMGLTTQEVANALTEAFTPAWYSIWIDDGFVSERYGAGQYETEAKAALICTALQMTYTSLCYECTFTPKLRD